MTPASDCAHALWPLSSVNGVYHSTVDIRRTYYECPLPSGIWPFGVSGITRLLLL